MIAYNRSATDFLLRLTLWSLLLTASGCATAHEDSRPHLEGMDALRLATGGMTYIFFAPPARAHDALEAVLQENFAVSYVRKEQKSDLYQYNMFSQIGTKFLYFKGNGKKFRKQCNTYVFVIPEYPGYSEVYVSCHLDVYELGLIHGRGGVHNLFTKWWDWYPERGLYVTEDMLEMVFRKLMIKEGEVIRLIGKEVYTKDEILQRIKEHEKSSN